MLESYKNLWKICQARFIGYIIITLTMKIKSVIKYLTHHIRVDSILSDSLQPHGLQPTRLFCPWNFPGKNTGVAISFSKGSSWPRDWTCISCVSYTAGRFFSTELLGKLKDAARLSQRTQNIQVLHLLWQKLTSLHLLISFHRTE